MSNKRAAQVTWSTDKDTQGIKPVYRRTGNDMILKSRGCPYVRLGDHSEVRPCPYHKWNEPVRCKSQRRHPYRWAGYGIHLAKEMRSWLGGLDITKHRSRHRKSARCKITNMKQYGYQNIHFFIHIESNRVRLYRSPV